MPVVGGGGPSIGDAFATLQDIMHLIRAMLDDTDVASANIAASPSGAVLGEALKRVGEVYFPAELLCIKAEESGRLPLVHTKLSKRSRMFREHMLHIERQAPHAREIQATKRIFLSPEAKRLDKVGMSLEFSKRTGLKHQSEMLRIAELTFPPAVFPVPLQNINQLRFGVVRRLTCQKPVGSPLPPGHEMHSLPCADSELRSNRGVILPSRLKEPAGAASFARNTS